METWHPLGVVAVISAFNFPAAVWSWNTAIALVCGDSVIWKPSPMTPLTSAACSALLDRATAEVGAPAKTSGKRHESRAPRRGARTSTSQKIFLVIRYVGLRKQFLQFLYE